MKKARQVEIPDRVLTYEEFEDLRSHAMNSSTWYAINYNRNSSQIKEKLISKGYKNSVIVYEDISGERKEINFIQYVIDSLVEDKIIDDESYAKNFIESKVEKGYGLSKIKFELSRKGVSEDIIENLTRDFQGEEKAALMFGEKIVNTSNYKSIKETYKKRQKITNSLAVRGFSFEVALNVAEALVEEAIGDETCK